MLIDRRQGERRQGDRRKASRAVPSPSLTPGQENAQGHSPAMRAAESYLRRQPVRGPAPMAVEDPGSSGAPAHAVAGSGAVTGFLGLSGGDSGSADYLLEDEAHNGRKWAVLLVIVVIAVLFYLQFRPYWRGQPAPPPEAPSQPAESAPQGKAPPASDATGVPAAHAPQQATTTPDPAASPPGADKDAAKTAAESPSKPDDPPTAKQVPNKDDPGGNQPPDPSDEQPATKPERQTPAHHRKPAAERSPRAMDMQSDPMLYMAQKYLYGEGARRDCDQAMVYLRAANQRASAPARSQMGALYATGHCVPLDRVRAYQWFTSALNVDPANSDVQRERNNLWGQMSSDERQQAVK